MDLLLAAGFVATGLGTFVFSVLPLLAGSGTLGERELRATIACRAAVGRGFRRRSVPLAAPRSPERAGWEEAGSPSSSRSPGSGASPGGRTARPWSTTTGRAPPS